MQKGDDDLNDSEAATEGFEGFNNSVSFFVISTINLSDQQGAVKKACYGKWKLESMKEKLSSLFHLEGQHWLISKDQ